jgi:hypothetical protein
LSNFLHSTMASAGIYMQKIANKGTLIATESLLLNVVDELVDTLEDVPMDALAEALVVETASENSRYL